MRQKEIEARIKALEEAVAQLMKRTVSQMTDEKITFAQVVDEWVNGGKDGQ